MNAKRANWAFLLTIIAYLLVSVLMVFLPDSVTSSLTLTNLMVEGVLMLPVLIIAAISKERLWDFFGFHKIKPGTILMIGLFTFFTSPVLTLVNAISLFWVENEAVSMLETYQVGNLPLPQFLLSMSVIAPICEEVTCRGGFYRSYRKSGGGVKAMLLSAVLFALIHMNFNQASYALIMGVLAVLLVEATGSVWSSIIYHGLINGGTSLIAYTALKSNPSVYAQQEITSELLMYTVGVYLVLAAVTLPIAFAVLVWISKHEGRESFWRDMKIKVKKDKLITIPLIVALILCLLVMTGIMKAIIGRWL